MGSRDTRVDAYIADAPAFAQPVLSELRERVHAVCPDVTEAFKWSHPFFEHHGVMCNMAAFKAHCSFGFWKAALMTTVPSTNTDEAHGQLGRLTSVKDLPAKRAFTAMVKEAMQLNESGATVPKPRKAAAKKSPAALAIPPLLKAALDRNRRALDTFDAFSPSHRKEYIEWITDAKTDATRERRVEQAIEMMSEGKSRHWKYQR